MTSLIPPFPTAADFRRATAMISHRAHGYPPGIAVVHDEAVQDSRLAQLLTALFECYATLFDTLRTPRGKNALCELITKAAHQHDDPNQQAAAAAMLAYTAEDANQLSRYLLAACHADWAAGLFGGVLDLFTALLPEVDAEAVRADLSCWVAEFAGKEARGTE
jgi:hypothetical protein